MVFFQISSMVFIILLCLYIHKGLCDEVDPTLTVENANDYIAQNKDKVVQTYRLTYHAMPPIGWTNDPNGFVFYKGEYHLFYQFNPYEAHANKIHWGHLKSKDLIHWEDLPVALAPDQDYDSNGVWSGSAIEKDGKLYVMYTGSTSGAQVQCIAVSEDGIHFEKIEQNPVLDANNLPSNAKPQDFRDPKVFKRDELYYCVLVSKTVNETGQVLLYQSSDLIGWEFKSILLEGTRELGSMWECPDLFEIDGKDVLLVSATEAPRSGNDYNNLDSVLAIVGEVDWEEGVFKIETLKEFDHGMDFYATQTTTDGDGERRIVTAWMNMWERNYPTANIGDNWAGAMILPRELSIEDGFLIQKPISEISELLEEVISYNNITLTAETSKFDKVAGKVGQVLLQANLAEAQKFTIELRVNDDEKTVISYNTSTEEITLDRSKSGIEIIGKEDPQVSSRKVVAPLVDSRLKLQIFLDVSSIEVFVNDGKESFTTTIYPTKEPSDLIRFITEGTVVMEKLTFSNINLKKL